MRSFVVLSFALPLTLAALACGSDDPTPADHTSSDASVDARGSSSNDAGGHEGHDAGGELEGPPLRCTDDELAANDKTGSPLEITFGMTGNPTQYENHCATVKVGATVTFQGSFVQHPLRPAGGNVPNPIPYQSKEPTDGKLTVTMKSPGTFGYECEYHPNLMFGAIKVVP